MMLYCDVKEIQTIDGGVKEKVYKHINIYTLGAYGKWSLRSKISHSR